MPYQDLDQLPEGSLKEGFTALLTADATTAYEREMEVARLREKVRTVEAESLHLKANEVHVSLPSESSLPPWRSRWAVLRAQHRDRPVSRSCAWQVQPDFAFLTQWQTAQLVCCH